MRMSNALKSAFIAASLALGSPASMRFRHEVKEARITANNVGWNYNQGRPVAVRNSPNRLSQKGRRKRARWSGKYV